MISVAWMMVWTSLTTGWTAIVNTLIIRKAAGTSNTGVLDVVSRPILAANSAVYFIRWNGRIA